MVFIPALWADVLTFRTDEIGTRHAINSPVFHQALIKHSCYIRGLTCSLDALPSLLTGCLNNYIEINLVVDPDYLARPTPSHGHSAQGPDDLSTVIASCPKLHTESIENLSTYHNNEIEDFLHL